ncbi:MAG: DUF1801 domain-containing protein [Chitinophagales bacterium]|nr:DUF1801 domain-containing protein [Chitinophagales bacterium]
MSKSSQLTIEQYIHQFSPEVRVTLNKLRSIILSAAPDAEETITYGIPAYKLNNKPLVYFGAYQSHIGFYATQSGHEKFAEELSEYKKGKGSIQFPLNKEIPIHLIKRMVEFKVEELSKRP